MRSSVVVGLLTVPTRPQGTCPLGVSTTRSGIEEPVQVPSRVTSTSTVLLVPYPTTHWPASPSLVLICIGRPWLDLGLGGVAGWSGLRPPGAHLQPEGYSPWPDEVHVWVDGSISQRHLGDNPCWRAQSTTLVRRPPAPVSLPVGVAGGHEVVPLELRGPQLGPGC